MGRDREGKGSEGAEGDYGRERGGRARLGYLCRGPEIDPSHATGRPMYVFETDVCIVTAKGLTAISWSPFFHTM